MTQKNAVKFIELLSSSEELQKKLQEAAAAYDGSKDDEKALFEAVIAPLAEEAGLPFTFDEGFEAAKAGRDLTDEELEAVAGGGGHGCYIVGISSEPDAWACEHGESGTGAACAWAGITLA